MTIIFAVARYIIFSYMMVMAGSIDDMRAEISGRRQISAIHYPITLRQLPSHIILAFWSADKGCWRLVKFL